MNIHLNDSNPVASDNEEVDVLGPSKTIITKAVPTGDGRFYAQFSAPGLIPRYSTRAHPPHDPLVFDTEEEAEEEARKAVVAIMRAPLNRRKGSKGKPDRYTKMTGPELAVSLGEVGLEPHLFAYIYGTSQERFWKWVHGEMKDGERIYDIPHPVRILLAIFKEFPDAINIAERVTEANTTERKPRD